MILTVRPTFLATVMVMVTTVTTAACADGGETTGEERPSVIATTTIWADVTSAVLCDVDVAALIPAGADPHSFEPSLRDRELVDGAATVVINGAGLDGSLSDLIGVAGRTFDISAHVELVDGDPHVWQDPIRVAVVAAAIADEVARPGEDTCDDDYVKELEQLDRDITEMLAPIPDNARVMVTSHDSLGYFASRYGIEVIGTVIPSTNTLAQTNSADLAALADLIEDRNVRAIFTERLASSGDADALADRLGVEVVPLVTDALTDDPATDTYLEMMRSNVALIAEALTP